MSFQLRGDEKQGGFWAVLISGILSVILAFMIFNNILIASAVALGVMLGIELLSNGVSMLVLGFAARKAAKAGTATA